MEKEIPLIIKKADIQAYGLEAGLTDPNQKTIKVAEAMERKGAYDMAETIRTVIDAVERAQKGQNLGRIGGDAANPQMYLQEKLTELLDLMGKETPYGKAIQMPNREDMERMLRKTGLMGISQDTDRALELFIKKVSGSSKVGAGLLLAWELAMYDAFPGQSADHSLALVTRTLFQRVIDAVTPHQAVIEKAEETKAELTAALKKETEARKPTPEQKAEILRSLEDAEFFETVHNIADMIVKEWKAAGYDMNRSRERVNPYYHQTTKGIFVEFYYGAPSKLWTPWGEFRINNYSFSTGNTEEVTKKILEKLGAKLFRKVEHNVMGTFGPVYSLHRFEGNELPEPSLRKPEAYPSYEAVETEWKILETGFRYR